MLTLFSAWDPPKDEGGRTDITYRVGCNDCAASSLVYNPSQDKINTNFVRIQNVEPNTQYRFRIYSQNGVSKYAKVRSEYTSKIIV